MSLPSFQAQNPAISGYRYGWSSCTAFSAAMAASYERQTAVLCSGTQVREKTGDHVGGLTLAQVDEALDKGWNVDLDTRYKLPWAEVVKRINVGHGAILTGGYGPIADSKYDAGNGFRGNHAIFVPPGWGVMDPLADGRHPNVYKYHAEPYPTHLLEQFAGALDTGNGHLGLGLAYVSFTADKVSPIVSENSVHVPAGRKFGIFTVVNGVVTNRRIGLTPGGFSAACTKARLYPWPGHAHQSLVTLTSGNRNGYIISSRYEV